MADRDVTPDPESAPDFTINRVALIDALAVMGIIDASTILRVDIDPQHVTITRYVRGHARGHLLDPAADIPATITTRIEIR